MPDSQIRLKINRRTRKSGATIDLQPILAVRHYTLFLQSQGGGRVRSPQAPNGGRPFLPAPRRSMMRNTSAHVGPMQPLHPHFHPDREPAPEDIVNRGGVLRRIAEERAV